MKPIRRSDVLELPVSERLELVGDIWDSIAQAPEAVELTEAQRVELERRDRRRVAAQAKQRRGLARCDHRRSPALGRMVGMRVRYDSRTHSANAVELERWRRDLISST